MFSFSTTAGAVRDYVAVRGASSGFIISGALLPLPVGTSLIACVLFCRLSWKKIGGCTGDVLGATIEISEIVFLLALAAEAKAGFLWGGFFPLLNLLPSGLFAAPAP